MEQLHDEFEPSGDVLEEIRAVEEWRLARAAVMQAVGAYESRLLRWEDAVG